MVTIVTDKSYIQTNKINSIYMDEKYEDHYIGRKHLTLALYTIHVNFEPIGNPNPNGLARNDHQMAVEIRVYGLKRAVLLFRDMVRQIREQCPDQLYLDKIAEKFLTGEIEDDPSPNEICAVGKEKRRDKAILRRAKPSRSRSRKRSRRK